MIDGKTLKFGYGDIAVGRIPSVRAMSFQQFKPPTKCGDVVVDDKVEYIGEQIILKISFADYQELSKLFNGVKSREFSVFVFKDYIFDFTNYNEASVDACRQELSGAMKWYFLAMAC